MAQLNIRVRLAKQTIIEGAKFLSINSQIRQHWIVRIGQQQGAAESCKESIEITIYSTDCVIDNETHVQHACDEHRYIQWIARDCILYLCVCHIDFIAQSRVLLLPTAHVSLSRPEFSPCRRRPSSATWPDGFKKENLNLPTPTNSREKSTLPGDPSRPNTFRLHYVTPFCTIRPTQSKE